MNPGAITFKDPVTTVLVKLLLSVSLIAPCPGYSLTRDGVSIATDSADSRCPASNGVAWLLLNSNNYAVKANLERTEIRGVKQDTFPQRVSLSPSQKHFLGCTYATFTLSPRIEYRWALLSVEGGQKSSSTGTGSSQNTTGTKPAMSNWPKLIQAYKDYDCQTALYVLSHPVQIDYKEAARFAVAYNSRCGFEESISKLDGQSAEHHLMLGFQKLLRETKEKNARADFSYWAAILPKMGVDKDQMMRTAALQCGHKNIASAIISLAKEGASLESKAIKYPTIREHLENQCPETWEMVQVAMNNPRVDRGAEMLPHIPPQFPGRPDFATKEMPTGVPPSEGRRR